MSSQEKQEIRSYRYTTINSVDILAILAYFTVNVFHDLILISSRLIISSPFPYQTIFLGFDSYKILASHREKVDSSQTCTSQMNELGLISTFFLNPRSSPPKLGNCVDPLCLRVSVSAWLKMSGLRLAKTPKFDKLRCGQPRPRQTVGTTKQTDTRRLISCRRKQKQTLSAEKLSNLLLLWSSGKGRLGKVTKRLKL